MTDEEFISVWEESGRRQREYCAMLKLDPPKPTSDIDPAMLARWQDGSDIFDRDDDEEEYGGTIPDDMPLDDVKVYAVNWALRHGFSKTEALAKFDLDESYYDDNNDRLTSIQP